MRPHILSALLHSLESHPVSDEDAVLLRYPQAETVYYEPIFQHGESTPYRDGEWVIVDLSTPEACELGRGMNEEEAWADAARTVASQPCAEEQAA